MRFATGAWRPRNSSSSTELAAISLGGAVAFCVGAGVVAVALDMVFRLPLHLPGHHGLTEMALLVMARCVSGRRWGASLSGATSAVIAALPVVGMAPWAPGFFLLTGLVIDGACLLFPMWRDSVWLLALAGAAANGVKGLALWALVGAGAHGHALAAGPALLVLSHVGFGFAGALIAAQLWAATKKLR